jgi:hypothetical protein
MKTLVFIVMSVGDFGDYGAFHSIGNTNSISISAEGLLCFQALVLIVVVVRSVRILVGHPHHEWVPPAGIFYPCYLR